MLVGDKLLFASVNDYKIKLQCRHTKYICKQLKTEGTEIKKSNNTMCIVQNYIINYFLVYPAKIKDS